MALFFELFSLLVGFNNRNESKLTVKLQIDNIELHDISTAWHKLYIHYFSLSLDHHPIDTNLRTSLSDRSVVVNTSFNIMCSSKAKPPAKYRFYKDHDNFVNDTTSSDVSVITTSFNERVKQVNYLCTPFNDFGDGPTEVITVTVLCKYTA